MRPFLSINKRASLISAADGLPRKTKRLSLGLINDTSIKYS
jgi:hypothetical protein